MPKEVVHRVVARAHQLPLTSLVSAIGRRRFEDSTLNFLHEYCGRDNLSMFEFLGGVPQRMISLSIDGSDAMDRQA